MTRTQKWIVAFWVFIGVMCIWSIFSYNATLNQEAEQHPAQTKFVFLHTNAAPVAPVAARADKADVEQVHYEVQLDTPSRGSFTSVVTLKNLGTVPATNIQINIRPYRGASALDLDAGRQNAPTLSDDDPLAKFGDWLSFPDLAPGESATRTDVFVAQLTDLKPGSNAKPQIIFESDKKGPMKPRAPEAATPSTTPAPAPDTTPNRHHAADN
jgi:hypothetical protein